VVVDQLVGEGVDPGRAAAAASAAAGDLGRARVLATDERLELRRRAWWELVDRLDGTGSAAVVAVDELLAMIDDALESLNARHEAELAALEERVKQLGERGAGRKDLVDRHRREQRRYRTDEIRYGLAVLAGRYREQLLVSARPAQVIEALDAIQELSEELIRNPNERLQLQALALRLGAAGG
jgi:DNA polymerase III subunit delta'